MTRNRQSYSGSCATRAAFTLDFLKTGTFLVVIGIVSFVSSGCAADASRLYISDGSLTKSYFEMSGKLSNFDACLLATAMLTVQLGEKENTKINNSKNQADEKLNGKTLPEILKLAAEYPPIALKKCRTDLEQDSTPDPDFFDVAIQPCPKQDTARISVSATGEIRFNDRPTTIERVAEELRDHGSTLKAVCIHREHPWSETLHPAFLRAMAAVGAAGLLERLCWYWDDAFQMRYRGKGSTDDATFGSDVHANDSPGR